MFGKFTVNNHDWLVVEQYFRVVSPQIVDSFIDGQTDKPWQHNLSQDIMKAYTATYNLCTAKQSRNGRMYAFYQKTLEEFMMMYESKILEKGPQDDLLAGEINQWEAYMVLVRICNRVFQYLDRYHVADAGLESIKKKAIGVYQCHFSPNVVQSIGEEFVVRLRMFRKNQAIQDDKLVKISTIFKQILLTNASEIYVQLNKYIRDQTVSYYHDTYCEWLYLDPEVYVKNALTLLDFQTKLFEMVLPGQDSLEFKHAFNMGIIYKYLPTLFSHSRGVALFFKQERSEILNQVYNLLKTYHNLDELKRSYYTHVRAQGFELFSSLKTQDSQNVIAALGRFNEHVAAWTAKVFESSQQFSMEMRKVLETVIHLHDQEFSLSEKLVRCISDYFTRRAPGDSLQSTMIVFDCLTNKDTFMSAYQSNLTNRLVDNRFFNLEEESKFIESLRDKCGDNFTESIQTKIKDYTAATVLNKQFRQKQDINDFTVKVLSKKFWVVENSPDVEFSVFDIEWPLNLIPLRQKLQEFYVGKFPNRHIQHLPLLSTLLLTIRNLNSVGFSQCEVNVNLLQGAILIYVEDSHREITQTELLSRFKVSPEMLHSQLELLLQGINPLLMIGPGGLKFNDNFNEVKSELDVAPLNIRKNSKAQALGADRELSIQGAIVRTLKGKRQYLLQQLIEQVLKLLKFFKPSVSKIKEAIDRLIQKEFVERDPQDMNIFMYKA